MSGSFIVPGNGGKEEHAPLNISGMTVVDRGDLLDLVQRFPQAVAADQVAEPALGKARRAADRGSGTSANPDRWIGLLRRTRLQGHIVNLVIASLIGHMILAQNPRQDL